MAIAQLKTVLFLGCPSCGDEEAFRLPTAPDSFGPYYCKCCGAGVVGEVVDGELQIERVPNWFPTLQLVIVPQPIALLTSTLVRTTDMSLLRYSVEEMTCPVNIFNRPIHSVITPDDGTNLQGLPLDTDPHGLLQLAAIAPLTLEMQADDYLCNLSASEIDDLFSGILAENLAVPLQ